MLGKIQHYQGKLCQHPTMTAPIDGNIKKKENVIKYSIKIYGRNELHAIYVATLLFRNKICP